MWVYLVDLIEANVRHPYVYLASLAVMLTLACGSPESLRPPATPLPPAPAAPAATPLPAVPAPGSLAILAETREPVFFEADQPECLDPRSPHLADLGRKTLEPPPDTYGVRRHDKHNAQELEQGLVWVIAYDPDDHTNHTFRSYGFVVDGGGRVATYLDAPSACLAVEVPETGVFTAVVDRVDSLTHGVTLRLEGDANLPGYSGELGTISEETDTLVLTLDREGSPAKYEEGKAVPRRYRGRDGLGPYQDGFIQLPAYEMATPGDAVFDTEERLLGFGTPYAWLGQLTLRTGGAPPGPPRYIVSAEAMRNLAFSSSEAVGVNRNIPFAVAYGSRNQGGFIDTPEARQILASPVQSMLQSLGPQVWVKNLGQDIRSVAVGSGFSLEVVYWWPQELRLESGESLGSARYVVVWFGQPNLLLIGSNPYIVEAAFTLSDTGEIERAVDEARSYR